MSLITLFTTKCRACGMGSCTIKRLFGDLASNLNMTLEIHGCKEFHPKGEFRGYKYNVVHRAVGRSPQGNVDYLTTCGNIISIFDKEQGLTFQSQEATCSDCLEEIIKQIREGNKKELGL